MAAVQPRKPTNDAEAIAEAATRPTMRIVEPKTEEQQARAVAFRAREQRVEQRTEAINVLRPTVLITDEITAKDLLE